MGLVCPLLAASWQVSENLPLGKLTLGIYVAVAGLLILCEYALAFRDDWGTTIRGTKTDFLYVILGAALEKASFLACVTVVASIGWHLSSYLQIELWPRSWAFGFQVVAALLIADMGTYFRHRLFHKSSMLWRFHQIHHSPTGLLLDPVGPHPSPGAALHHDCDHAPHRVARGWWRDHRPGRLRVRPQRSAPARQHRRPLVHSELRLRHARGSPNPPSRRRKRESVPTFRHSSF